jgi:hypothetical protein
VPAYSALQATKYAQIWAKRYRDHPLLAKHAGKASQTRLAFYHLGLAKALALDKIFPEWKRRYFEAGVWLDDLLIDATERTR